MDFEEFWSIIPKNEERELIDEDEIPLAEDDEEWHPDDYEYWQD